MRGVPRMRRRIGHPPLNLQDTVRLARPGPEDTRPGRSAPGDTGLGVMGPGDTGQEAQPGSVPADLETAGEWPFPRASGESRTSSAGLTWPTTSLGSRPPSPATAASSA